MDKKGPAMDSAPGLNSKGFGRVNVELVAVGIMGFQEDGNHDKLAGWCSSIHSSFRV